jgi:hypothetical protein
VEHHGAVVAPRLGDGQSCPAGVEELLDTSQVYVRLPADPGRCHAIELKACPAGHSRTYTRTMDLCLMPDKYADDAVVRPGCDDVVEIITPEPLAEAARTRASVDDPEPYGHELAAKSPTPSAAASWWPTSTATTAAWGS